MDASIIDWFMKFFLNPYVIWNVVENASEWMMKFYYHFSPLVMAENSLSLDEFDSLLSSIPC